MKHASYVALSLVGGLISQAACRGGEPVAPLTPELLPVAVQTRSPVPGEMLPVVHVTGGAGIVTIHVTTLGVCVTAVNARISRAPHDLAVVSRITFKPDIACIDDLEGHVADYQGTIMSVSEGSYRVRIFESFLGAQPRLIASTRVSVTSR
jgi:hypothetical protein